MQEHVKRVTRMGLLMKVTTVYTLVPASIGLFLIFFGMPAWYTFVGITLVALAVCGWATSTVLSGRLERLEETSKALAQGDISQKFEVESGDELGSLAAAYGEVVEYLHEMSDVAERLADGDLTVQARPRGANDALGKAHARLIDRQRDLIGRTKLAAVSVADASRQLSRASEQTAQATQQITATMQQVARGASEQSASLQQTAGSVDQLSRAIEQIAAGAHEQARAVEEATRAVEAVTSAIESVSENAQAGSKEWDATAESAMGGARKANETVVGMDKIKKAMELVSARVSDLGQRSGDIGNIVATIDDIAAQTNLLALNAAIEAARAGEQGRGFAVVADEVRKLAERSSTATKEIAALVSGTQAGVREAMSAMEQGTKEVEAGYKLATDAGGALDEILTRSQNVKKQVAEISAATGSLMELSQAMKGAMHQIIKIVEENAAATQQMTASSEAVASAVEATAGVAQENSSASEEVSASTEQMSAQVQQALAAAQSLADTAEEMAKLVEVFRTDEVQIRK